MDTHPKSLDKKYIHYANILVSDEATKHLTAHTERIINDSQRLVALAENWKNCAQEITQGRMFEQLEVTKFNLDSLGKDAKFYAATTDSLGDPHAAADILIKEGKHTVREVQAKSCNTAARSLFAQSKEKYAGMDRLVPVDQTGKAVELAEKRIATGTNKANDYAEALPHLKGKLEHDAVQSSGTTYAEAIESTDVNTAQDLSKSYQRDAILGDMHHSGLQAAKISGITVGVLSSAKGFYRIIQGEATVGETLAQISVDTTTAAMTGYVSTALSKGIAHKATTFGLSEVGAKALVKSNGHVALAAGIVQSGKSLISYLKGDIDSEQLFSEINHTSITGASAFYYGALGQLAIPIPFVGMIVGSSVGYFIGTMLHQSGLLSLGECEQVRVARERRQAIEEMCLVAIPLMRAHRLELESWLKQHFAERQQRFSTAFDMMEKAMFVGNTEEYLKGLSGIASVYNCSLPFQTFESFDTMMRNKSATIEF